MTSWTTVERVPDQLGYHCGYCNHEDTAKAKGMWAHSMNVIDYQTLIDRGWRRSGKYCYMPIMKETCCPQYAIRCRALEYEPTKSKKKVLNKMRQFLMSEGDEDILKWKKKNAYEKSRKIDSDTKPEIEAMDVHATPQDEQPTKIVRKGTGPDPTKPSCQKAKAMRQAKCKKSKINPESGDAPSPAKLKNELKSLEDLIPHLNPSPDFKRKLEVRMIRANVRDPDFQKTKVESHAVYQKYQAVIHNDAPSKCDERQWMRFLVDCPLNYDKDGPGPGFGNYHQQYLLDGKIIAVGVLDILSYSTSSVYLYYDPDYGFLSLGVYTAISEIAYTVQLHKEYDQLIYYYMGFYIHSCPKMNYKRHFPPSELLCPETFDWVPFQLCLPALDKSEYSRLNVLNGGSPTALDPARGEDFDMDKLGVIYRRNLLNYHRYVRWKYIAVKFPEQEVYRINEEKAVKQQKVLDKELIELKEYVSLVGTGCAERMYLYRASSDNDFWP